MICRNCHESIDEHATYCPFCGAPVQPTRENHTGNDPFAAFSNVEDVTDEFDADDIQQNKGIAVLSYLGLLFLIPLLAAKNSRFAQFHTNQGLVLFLTEIALSVSLGILSAIFSLSGISVLIFLFRLIRYAANVACLIFAIIGIVNVCQGKAKKLPIIGEITIIK